MLRINHQIAIPEDEIRIQAVRSQGAGGQNVNKVSSAIHLRFDITASSLSDSIKARLLATRDRRINKNGIMVIKAQRYRDQEKNRTDALERLKLFIKKALVRQKKRIATKPTRRARQQRMDNKTHTGRTKRLRKKPDINS